MYGKLVSNGGQTIELLDRQGKKIKEFVVKDDLAKALELLKQINSLETKNGFKIYHTRLYEDKSTWAFHQQNLFLVWLRGYVKYAEIVEYFQAEAGLSYILEVDNKLSDLCKYLALAGVRVKYARSVKYYWETIARSLIFVVNKIISLLISSLAILKLKLLKPETILYTPDKFRDKSRSDFRFAVVYDYLRKNKVRYLEVMHSTLGKEFLLDLWKRRRLVIYLESFPVFNFSHKPTPEFDLTPIEEKYREVIKNLLKLIDKEAQRSQKLIKVLRKILKSTEVKRLLSMDDPRYVQELVTACRVNNIKTYAFEHGHLTKYHAGWMNYGIPKDYSVPFDKLFVWNQYWKNILLRYSTYYDDSNVSVGGPLHPPRDIGYKKKSGEIKDCRDLNLLIPYESIAPKEDIRPYIKLLKDLGTTLHFKLRPDVDNEVQLKEYGVSEKEVKVIKEIDREVLSTVDAAVGVYTTFLNEMLYYHKPVFILQTSFDLGSQLLEDDIAFGIDLHFNPSDMLDKINSYQSRKQTAWPDAPPLEDTLASIFKDK